MSEGQPYWISPHRGLPSPTGRLGSEIDFPAPGALKAPWLSGGGSGSLPAPQYLQSRDVALSEIQQAARVARFRQELDDSTRLAFGPGTVGPPVPPAPGPYQVGPMPRLPNAPSSAYAAGVGGGASWGATAPGPGAPGAPPEPGLSLAESMYASDRGGPDAYGMQFAPGSTWRSASTTGVPGPGAESWGPSPDPGYWGGATGFEQPISDYYGGAPGFGSPPDGNRYPLPIGLGGSLNTVGALPGSNGGGAYTPSFAPAPSPYAATPDSGETSNAWWANRPPPSGPNGPEIGRIAMMARQQGAGMYGGL